MNISDDAGRRAALAERLDSLTAEQLYAELGRHVLRVEPALRSHLAPADTYEQWLDLMRVADASLRGLWAPGEVVRLLSQGTVAEVGQEAARRAGAWAGGVGHRG